MLSTGAGETNHRHVSSQPTFVRYLKKIREGEKGGEGMGHLDLPIPYHPGGKRKGGGGWIHREKREGAIVSMPVVASEIGEREGSLDAKNVVR